jgi:hypothetical protein
MHEFIEAALPARWAEAAEAPDSTSTWATTSPSFSWWSPWSWRLYRFTDLEGKQHERSIGGKKRTTKPVL